MSTLRFRAWHKTHKKMIGPEELWAHDTVINPANCRPVQPNPTPEGYVTWESVPELELMMSTGLKDQHGREIFEGDVVMFENDFEGSMYPPEAPELHNDFAVVEWDNQFATFLTHAKGEYNRCHDTMPLGQRMDEYGDMEVIGNIHENPDLLPSA